jgi:type I restriction enzyme, S subunit
MSSVVPEGWENRQFGQFCREKSVKFDGKSELPVLSVTKYDGFVSSLDYFNKQVFSRDLSSYKVVRKGQFAYATIHLDEGSLGLLSDYDGGLISPMYTVFETTQECDSKFLFFLMKSDLYMTKYPALGQGSINRRMSISFRSLSELNIATPPLPEQKKIASILTSVDEVIENTSRQMLTKGIGHTEFKDSELGRIPKSWEARRLGDLCDKTAPITYGVLKPGEYIQGGIPLLQVKDLSNGTVLTDDLHRISKTLDREYIRSRIQSGDVLISLIGTVGRVALVPKLNETYNIHRNIGRIRVQNPDWVSIYLQSPRCVKQIILLSSGSSQSALNLSELKELLVPQPPLEEKFEILKLLQSVTDQCNIQKQKLAQTQSLKKSLMQDLLTGKVRVTVN